MWPVVTKKALIKPSSIISWSVKSLRRGTSNKSKVFQYLHSVSFQNKLQKCERTKPILHLAYRLDLGPSDYYLFQYVALLLRLQLFNHQDDVETSLKESFASKKKNWYQSGIKELAERGASKGKTLDFQCLDVFVPSGEKRQIS